MNSDTSIVLVLSGGNALGAYQAGGYESLHDRGLEPDWVVGASTGAINGAIICGNPASERVTRLQEYWKPANDAVEPSADGKMLEDARRSAAAAMTLALGQPNVFTPKLPSLPW